MPTPIRSAGSWFRAIVALFVLVASASFASGARAEDAASLYERGKELYAAGQLAEAEKVFEKALAQRRTYDVASQLGAVKLELGKAAEGAALLSYAYENWAPSGNPAGKASTKKRLEQALGKIAVIEVTSNVADPVLMVDGVIAAESERLYLEPGVHTIEASKRGYVSEQRTVEAKAGTQERLRFELRADESGPQPPNGDGRAEPDHPLPAVLGVGYGFGGAAAVASVVLGIVGATKGSDAASLADTLRVEHGERPCAMSDPRCAEVADMWAEHRDLVNPALWIGVGAGVVLVTTVIYHAASGETGEDPDITLVPLVGPRTGGVGASLHW